MSAKGGSPARLRHMEPDPFTKHAEILRKLYEGDGLTAAQVQVALGTQSGFPKMSLKAFQRGLSQLRLKKNLKRVDWVVVGEHLRARGPEQQTGVYIHGVLLPWPKVWKELRRSGFKADSPQVLRGGLSKLPAGVRVDTPPHPQLPELRISKLDITYPDLRGMTVSSGLANRLSHLSQLPAGDKGGQSAAVSRVPRSSAPPERNNQTTISGPTRPGENLLPCLVDFFLDNYRIPWRQLEHCITPILVPAGMTRPIISSELQVESSSAWLEYLKSQSEAMSPTARSPGTPIPSKSIRQYCFTALSCTSIFEDCCGIRRDIEDIDFRARALYQLSNDLISLGSRDDHARLLDFLAEKFSGDLLDRMFKIAHDLPTIRAFWEKLVHLAKRGRHKTAFRALMHLVLYKPNCRPWIASSILVHYETARDLGCDDIRLQLIKGQMEAQFIETWRRACLCPFTLEPVLAMQYYIKGIFSIRQGADDLFILREKFIYYLWMDQQVRPRQRDKLHPDHGLRCEFLKTLVQHGGLRNPGQSRGSFLDVLYESDQALYAFTAELVCLPAGEATLSGAIAASKKGPDFFSKYLRSRTHFQEGHAQNFLHRLLERFSTTVDVPLSTIEAVLLEGANPNSSYSSYHDCNLENNRHWSRELADHSPWRKQQCSLLWYLAFDSAGTSISEEVCAHRCQIISLLAQFGAKVEPAVLAAPLRQHRNILNSHKILQTLIGVCGPSVPTLGGQALFAAAILDDYDALVLLHSAGASLTAELPVSCLTDSQKREGLRTPLEIAIAGDPRYAGAASLDMMRHLLNLARATNGPLPPELLGCINGGVLSSPFALDRLKSCEILEEYGFDPFSHPPQRRDVHRLFDNTVVERNQRALEFFEFLLDRRVSVDDVVLAGLIDRDAKLDLVERALAVRTDASSLEDPYTRVFLEERADGPLRASIRAANLQLVELFLKRYLDTCKTAAVRGEMLGHVLQYACERPAGDTKMKIVNLLLAEGADINASAKDPLIGLTALQAAARCGDLSLAVLLLERGASLNAITVVQWASKGKINRKAISALDFAALDGHLDMVQFLLNAGAVSGEPGDNGYDRAIRWAEGCGHGAVAEVIRGHAEFMASLEPRPAF